MNSFYGVLGTSACRFYDPRLANAITSFGREVLLWCAGRIEAGGRRVLYGDTDSLFVESGEADAAAARRLGETLAGRADARAGRAHSRAPGGSRADWSCSSSGSTCGSAFPPSATARPGRASATRASSWTGRTAGRLHRHGGGAGRLDRPRQATCSGSSSCASSPTSRSTSTCARLVAELRAGRLDDRLVYRKALRKEPGGLHGDHAAPRRRRPQDDAHARAAASPTS